MANGGAGTIESSDDDCKDSENNGVTKITDVTAFKSSQSLYPLMKPFNNVPRKGQQSKL